MTGSERILPSNESEWGSCSTLELMLDVLRKLKPGKSKLGRRKLRLYACACCRNWWSELSPNSRQALEITERYADGYASRSEFGLAQRISTYDFGPIGGNPSIEVLRQRYTIDGAMNWLTSSAEIAGGMIGHHLCTVAGNVSSEKRRVEEQREIALLHEIFGNPFSPPKLDQEWLRWNDGAIPKLAQEIYASPLTGDYDHLEKLLKQVGCNDSAFLDHCRAPHSHVKGCWLLDVLTGRHWPKRGLPSATL